MLWFTGVCVCVWPPLLIGCNPLLFRELLSCEAALTSMYCRSALLSLRPLLSPTSSYSWVTHFTLLVNQYFAQPSADGHASSPSPLMASSPQSSICYALPSPHSVFFTDSLQVEKEVAAGLRVYRSDLHRLASGVCAGLTSSPLLFGASEFKVPESKEQIDVSGPGSAFLVLSCPEDKSKSSSV